MNDVRKPNFKSMLKSVIPVRPVLNTGQTGWTYPRASPVYRTCLIPYRLLEPFAEHVWYWTRLVRQTIWSLEFELHRTSSAITGHARVLTQICQFREFTSESALSPVGVTTPVWPVWWTDLTGRVWQPQWLVFHILYKRYSTPTLMGCWFLTVFIIFWQPPEHSPTSLCEI
jgi:hypothetical protein